MGEAEREAARENPKAFTDQLETYRTIVERGDMRFAVLVVDTCLTFGLPIPEWLEGHVSAAVRFYAEKGGKRQGSKGNAIRTRDAQIDVARYQCIERERARPRVTFDEALAAASVILRSTPARGEAGELEASYYRIDRLYRTNRRKPGPKAKPKK